MADLAGRLPTELPGLRERHQYLARNDLPRRVGSPSSLNCGRAISRAETWWLTTSGAADSLTMSVGGGAVPRCEGREAMVHFGTRCRARKDS